MKRVLFTDSPESVSDENVRKMRDHYGGKSKKKVIAAPPKPMFKIKTKKKKKN